jgi:hypothetical protein
MNIFNVLTFIPRLILLPYTLNYEKRKFADSDLGYIFLILQNYGLELSEIKKVYFDMQKTPKTNTDPLQVCLLKSFAKTQDNAIPLEAIENALDTVKQKYTVKQAEDFFYRCCHTKFKENKIE